MYLMSIIIALLYYMLKLYRSYSGWHKKTVKKRHAGLLENGCIAVLTNKNTSPFKNINKKIAFLISVFKSLCHKSANLFGKIRRERYCNAKCIYITRAF